MPPKRATAIGKSSLGPKRIKASVDNYKNISDHDEYPARPLRKAAQKEVRYLEKDFDNDDEDDDDDEPLIRNRKGPPPKSKKKASPETVPTKPKQQPATSASLTKASSAPPPSILKTKTKWDNQDNQENQSVAANNNTNNTNNKPNDNGKNTKGQAAIEQLSASLDDLNAKYKRLKQLRETEAEKNLKDCRAQLEEATRNAEDYRLKVDPQLESAQRSQEILRENNEILNAKVRTLQRQLREYEEKFRQRDQEDRIKAKAATMESILASPDVTPTSVAKASTISLYENLSGLKVIPRDAPLHASKDKLPTTWDCEHSGPRGTLRFSLTYDNKNNKVSYTPYIDEKRDRKLLEYLPDYLTDEIEFDREFESKFFWRILNFNNDDTLRE
ncbi:hypothetical protein B0O80DRAFT_208596 [Mortierella sp. GBAus27b]|nr:hypothetical protein BGX31_007161 [Mortierella sp. GBA43]KAI8360649.1 hypothetical protein B0O80DRAFT_208596 [Mortierella sp. GBAus27b]